MRIIDKNTDFYDFWQDIYRDSSITFDRTDSFVLSKDIMCDYIRASQDRFYTVKDFEQQFVLLQICHTFWLFLVEVTKKTDYDRPTEYTVQLVVTWKNYHKPRCLIRLDLISFGYKVDHLLGRRYDNHKYDSEKVSSKTNVLISAVNSNDYRINVTIDKHTIYKGDNTKEEKHIPLLKASGMASCMESLDVFLAFEEFFSLEKTATERTESAGLTNNEKISNHGFDIKTSFRGNKGE